VTKTIYTEMPSKPTHPAGGYKTETVTATLGNGQTTCIVVTQTPPPYPAPKVARQIHINRASLNIGLSGGLVGLQVSLVRLSVIRLRSLDGECKSVVSLAMVIDYAWLKLLLAFGQRKAFKGFSLD